MRESGFRRSPGEYGTDHHEFELTRETDIASAVEDMAWYSDEPGADAGALPVPVSKMSRRHVTVALSGEGGDEVVRWLYDLSRRRAFSSLAPFAASAAPHYSKPPVPSCRFRMPKSVTNT